MMLVFFIADGDALAEICLEEALETQPEHTPS